MSIELRPVTITIGADRHKRGNSVLFKSERWRVAFGVASPPWPTFWHVRRVGVNGMSGMQYRLGPLMVGYVTNL